ncbi:hypothetical protein ZYGR_0AD04970 [Zygosaccharomyces rouxii]|uniref:ZYRO0G17534p n=2 Tax=Zygosaccharomyces rouxii TaxID=4956 RepID=C5E127_ZYGRC|nr:uncharacterized protein ZYRO0G17534g [Zygosaccharomyces rouxii]KAH9202804.1 hypothetical protein LQ764DRAFT_227047 [Zygosaccharomyces rouxii]GAV51314.1 hypothetical protein ZYGR_0AD04970 [Zygosaccharomyces rouxii]CAR29811.1 ZYRO0G17534p [Zygosaccharomyces rouxii]
MDPAISSNFNSFSDMVLNSEHQQNNLEADFYDFYLNDGHCEEDKDSDNEHENDEEEEPDFESSQLHQLVHTQPIHLINYQMLSDYTLRKEKDFEDHASSRSSILATFEDIEVISENAVNFFDGGNMTDDVNTAATSATGAHFKHDLLDVASEEWNIWKQQVPISNFYQSNNTTVGPPEATVGASGTAPLKNSQEMDWEVPRSLPFEYKDAGHYLDFSHCINLQDELEVPPLHLQQPPQCHNRNNSENNYNYQITTDASFTGRRPTEEENFFVKTLNSKLYRYTGYFGAGSRDQDYHDKVRFQEISYKFSKTYF